MKFDFVPVDYDYFDFEGHNYVRMIGRSGKGEKICVIDSYEPNFWVILRRMLKRNLRQVVRWYYHRKRKTQKITQT